MHYVTNDWRHGKPFYSYASIVILICLSALLEEVLLDFREMIGAHSGENMAEAVFAKVVEYGLEDKVYRVIC